MEPAFQGAAGFPSDVRPKSIHEIAGLIREGIGTGRFQPQERLVEESLARTFETNRAVVRGALALLEQERLIVRERNRGARVRAISATEATQILEVRAVLEGLIARQAALRIDGPGVAELREKLARMRALTEAGDLRAYLQCNADFHAAIARIAAHDAASNLLDVLQSQSRRFQFRSVVYHDRLASSLEEHERIVDALERHDAEGAEAALRAHVQNVADTVGKIGHLDFQP